MESHRRSNRKSFVVFDINQTLTAMEAREARRRAMREEREQRRLDEEEQKKVIL
jgi:hypothetical protein